MILDSTFLLLSSLIHTLARVSECRIFHFSAIAYQAAVSIWFTSFCVFFFVLARVYLVIKSVCPLSQVGIKL